VLHVAGPSLPTERPPPAAPLDRLLGVTFPSHCGILSYAPAGRAALVRRSHHGLARRPGRPTLWGAWIVLPGHGMRATARQRSGTRADARNQRNPWEYLTGR